MDGDSVQITLSLIEQLAFGADQEHRFDTTRFQINHNELQMVTHTLVDCECIIDELWSIAANSFLEQLQVQLNTSN